MRSRGSGGSGGIEQAAVDVQDKRSPLLEESARFGHQRPPGESLVEISSVARVPFNHKLPVMTAAIVGSPLDGQKRDASLGDGTGRS